MSIYKQTTQWIWGDELNNLTENELDIWIDCMWSDIRWDILVKVFQKFDMLQRYADGMWF